MNKAFDRTVRGALLAACVLFVFMPAAYGSVSQTTAGDSGSFYRLMTADPAERYGRYDGMITQGLAGHQPWTNSPAVPVGSAEFEQLARIIHAEARGESFAGQVAVGAVVLNRVRAEGFPDTVSGVIHQPRAFTAVADGQYELEPNDTAYRAALEAVRGWDPTGGALYYYNPDIATSDWIRTREPIVTIGRHIFAR
ncbi:spore cortex-lytic protein [Paenibacillus sp. 32O-W]|uniref:Cell wall hydrolase SleB domain-containing protein n=1 Tax=Paenibacillus cisolokensis TaxID=1658519 RepID=A0ABQ4NBJ1_9BACL|nr:MULTISPECIES: cell wall hydrolase [Paenibacillus]ALS27701.1 spore cortex-lytic protein [Paenibacillus sp. 32O-W]GIQ65588.1 hypothetical protein PACILC2_41560 [Paenibacillus cisolokensis]